MLRHVAHQSLKAAGTLHQGSGRHYRLCVCSMYQNHKRPVPYGKGTKRIRPGIKEWEDLNVSIKR